MLGIASSFGESVNNPALGAGLGDTYTPEEENTSTLQSGHSHEHFYGS